MEYENRNNNTPDQDQSLIRLIFLVCASVFIGYLFGQATTNISPAQYFSTPKTSFKSELINQENIQLFKNRVNSNNIERHLKYLTSVPHLAGTDGDKITADYVLKEWLQQGLDVVTPTSYNVLLDYPDEVRFNSIEIRNSDQTLAQTYEIKEEVLDADNDYSKITKPFLAYSINGSFSFSEIYYVNYCGDEDFKLFLNETGVDLSGKTCLCRYGQVFRGNKVHTAEKYGVKAVLLYDDPYRSAPLNSSSEVYPNGELMPEYGTQRGTVFVHEGDPLTPNYPSIESAYRVAEPNLPKIAAQVIGYKIAEELFNLMRNNSHQKQQVPEAWRGQLNTSYTFGGFLESNQTLTLNVYNKRSVRAIHNVMGVIRGSTEPDRYVIIGNHRDSWTYGSMDPSFGTSVMLEVSRMLINLRRTTGWRPKRSILFQSWSGEEYGLVGSTEWVEEFEKKLSANGVVYINLDVSIYGNYSYEAQASPLLFDMLYDVTKLVNVSEEKSVYDRWLENDPGEKLPNISPFLGSGSDHMAFLQRAGIPCIDQKFGREKKSLLSRRMGSSYPLYHTSYETFNLATKTIDPGFTGSKLLAVIVAEISRTLASSTLLPFNVNTYASTLQHEFERYLNTYRPKFAKHGIELDNLQYAIHNFTLSSARFMSRIQQLDLNNGQLVRQYNEQLRSLERSFLDYNKLKTRGYAHAIFAPSILNKYTSELFPSMTDLLIENTGENNTVLGEQIRFELSAIINAVQSASAILKEPTDFVRYVY